MEESSSNSSKNGPFSPKDGAAPSEESGWTMYFEDFMASEERRAANVDGGDGAFSSGVVSGNSLISDAASCTAWKPLSTSLEVSEKYRKLSLKKRKGKGLLDDDPLEDTASSPVNSPKVTESSYLTTNPSKKDGQRDTALNDAVGYRNDQELKEIVNGFNFVKGTNECSELKKRGLCLVPLSLFVDY
ncbi:hypothetical protein Cni_G23916 [Canna indica]|uniref:Uncharacterized protein n=1 Tax=Canna indica TaxID=4628 RepID=A0AAQ3QP16_9LILI|nr:hypothetical protein Cni_G23916 [Canna indica]